MAKFNVGHPFWKTTASLRVWGPGLDPDRVSQLLCCTGSSGIKMGEPDPERGGRLAKFGMWRLMSDHAIGASPDDHVRRILAQISSDPSPWHIDLKPFNKDLFLGGWMDHWNTCFSMDGDVLLELGSRGIPITFDLYAEDDGDDDDQEGPPATAEP